VALQLLVLVPGAFAPVAFAARAVEVALYLVCCATKTFFLVHVALAQVVVVHRLAIALRYRHWLRVRNCESIDRLRFVILHSYRGVNRSQSIGRVVELLEEALVSHLLNIFEFAPLLV